MFQITKPRYEDAQILIWSFDLKSQPLGSTIIKSDFYSGWNLNPCWISLVLIVGDNCLVLIVETNCLVLITGTNCLVLLAMICANISVCE